jgi:hypothetical protein
MLSSSLLLEKNSSSFTNFPPPHIEGKELEPPEPIKTPE